MDRLVVYKRSCRNDIIPQKHLDGDFIIKIWKPNATHFIPPQKPAKYLLYWIFHVMGIFKSNDYCVILVYKSNKLVASAMMVPRYFKWPFMADKDLQLTYVMTNPEFRGRGIGELMLKEAINMFSDEDRNLWYVTDTGNTASIRLCVRMGFNFFSYAHSGGLFKSINVIQ